MILFIIVALGDRGREREEPSYSRPKSVAHDEACKGVCNLLQNATVIAETIKTKTVPSSDTHDKLGPKNSQRQFRRGKPGHRGGKLCINTYYLNRCGRKNGRLLNDDHGQKLKCQVVPFSSIPLKVAPGSDRTFFPRITQA